MAADTLASQVGTDHHGHRIPPDDAFDPSFNIPAAGENRLTVGSDGVDIGCVDRMAEFDSLHVRACMQQVEQVGHPLGPLAPVNILQRLDPFPIFNIHRTGLLSVYHLIVLHECPSTGSGLWRVPEWYRWGALVIGVSRVMVRLGADKW